MSCHDKNKSTESNLILEKAIQCVKCYSKASTHGLPSTLSIWMASRAAPNSARLATLSAKQKCGIT